LFSLLYLVLVDKIPKGNNVGKTLLTCLKGCGRGEEKSGEKPIHVERFRRLNPSDDCRALSIAIYT
jgi:hypothetical protein